MITNSSLALKFLQGDYYIVASGKKSKHSVDVSITLMMYYHEKEYQATLLISSDNLEINAIHSNIFVTTEKNLPSMKKLLSEIARVLKQSKLYSRETLDVRFYKVGNTIATKKYAIEIK